MAFINYVTQVQFEFGAIQLLRQVPGRRGAQPRTSQCARLRTCSTKAAL